jgi:hypothetical protein
MTETAEILEYLEAELAKTDVKAKAEDWAEANVKYWAKWEAYWADARGANMAAGDKLEEDWDELDVKAKAKTKALVRSKALKAMILELKAKDND